MHASAACLLGPLPYWSTSLAQPLIASIYPHVKQQQIVFMQKGQQYKQYSASL